MEKRCVSSLYSRDPLENNGTCGKLLPPGWRPANAEKREVQELSLTRATSGIAGKNVSLNKTCPRMYPFQHDSFLREK